MSTPIVLPEGYRYVGAALVSSVWLLVWQTMVVTRYRKKSGIAYPQLYAEKAEAQASRDAHLFNCAQRTHQNTLEQIPGIVIMTLVSGVKHPILASSVCTLWVFGRVLYTIGYTSGDPTKRNSRGGFIGSFSSLALIFGSTYTAYQLLVGA